MAKKAGKPPRIALALAGGGPLGAIYEIGALCALEESLQGIEFTALDHYVGVSAGSFISAALVNGMRPTDLCKAFIEGDKTHPDYFDPSWLLVPAYGEMLQRVTLLPKVMARLAQQWMRGNFGILRTLEELSALMPTGIFSNLMIEERLAQLFQQPGRSNDFRDHHGRLTLVATHLDSASAVPFGSSGYDDVPISQAVQASSALPGLFPPVRINGEHYVDGALIKTMHASVALDKQVDLLICLNPLVPFDASSVRQERAMQRSNSAKRQRIPRISEGGLPSVMSQTFRSMIHSRMALGMRHYQHDYPDTDIVLIEPDHRDTELYLANVFSYSQRRHLAEHAYQETRKLLRTRSMGWGPKLAKHGIKLDYAILNDPSKTLCKPGETTGTLQNTIVSLEEIMDNLQHFITQSTPGNKRSTHG